MKPKVKYELEFPIHSSPQLLYQYIITPSGLSEWFSDNVNSRGEFFTFERRNVGRAVHAFLGLGLVHKQGSHHGARHRATCEGGHVLAFNSKRFVDGQLCTFIQTTLNGQGGW